MGKVENKDAPFGGRLNNYSVLISLYFKESPLHLREALDSIFSQTCRSNDVVLVEDGTLGDYSIETCEYNMFEFKNILKY